MSTSERLAALRTEIDQRARKAGRKPEEISLVAVTKGHSLEEITPLVEAGQRDLGESRVQEWQEKAKGVCQEIRWHFIGPLQRNKVRKVVGGVVLIHSVDSLALAQKISQVAGKLEAVAEILLEVNTSGEATKGGFSPEEWRALFPEVLALPNLRIQGLMTLAPLTDDEIVIRRSFRRLRELRETLQRDAGKRADLHHLSMGMSNDYAIAIEEGATLLRIGSALF